MAAIVGAIVTTGGILLISSGGLIAWLGAGLGVVGIMAISTVAASG